MIDGDTIVWWTKCRDTYLIVKFLPILTPSYLCTMTNFTENWNIRMKLIIFHTTERETSNLFTNSNTQSCLVLNVLTLKLKMKDKGHLVTRHLIVWLQLRLEECSRDSLNKLTAVWSHSPVLSHGPGGISPDPQFRKLVVFHRSDPLFMLSYECLRVVKVPHLSLPLFPSLLLMPLSLFSPTYFHWP